jgi:hypothetical protein
MTCEEAAEFVSALCDHETIPQAAAGHIGACASCQSRLREYIEMGVELRRVASLESLEEARPRAWEKRQANLSIWWQKGWETMRIPRIAFALLIMGIVGLTSGLTLVGVRAHAHEAAMMLNVALEPDHVIPCGLSFEDKKYSDCGLSYGLSGGMLTYRIRLLSKENDRVELGIKTYYAQGVHSNEGANEAMKSVPERRFWFEPGKTLQIDVDKLGPITVTGKWLDHVPYFAEMDLEHNLEPDANQIRMVSPILLKGDRGLYDVGGGSATTANQPDAAFWMYVPGSGLYVLSLAPAKNAVQGHVAENRVSFEIDGQRYQFVTAAPIMRGDTAWVLHPAGAHSPWGDSKNPSFGAGNLDPVLASAEAGK